VALAMPQRAHALGERNLPPAPARRLHGFRHRVGSPSYPEYPTGIALNRNLLFLRRYVEIAPLLKVLQEPRSIRVRKTEQFRAVLVPTA
jgi:hypothetical protein